MTDLAIAASLLLSLASCGETPAEDPAPQTVTPRLILKGELSQALQGVQVESVSKVSGGYSLRLTGGGSFTFDTDNYAIVGCDSLDRLCINGEPSPYDYVSSPLYTVGADGMWYKDGVKTMRRASPENFLAGPQDVYFTNVQEYPSRFVFNYSDLTADTVSRHVVHRMYVTKSSGRLNVFIGQDGDDDYVMYPFLKRYRTYTEGQYPSYFDNWGVGPLELHRRTEAGGFEKDCAIFLNGEAEMALNVQKADDPTKFTYVGGTLHGFENVVEDSAGRRVTFTVDGVALNETDALSLTEASVVEITQESLLCQAYTDSLPFARAFRRWTFRDGRLSIRIEVRFLRDIHVRQGMFGMMCVLRHWKASDSEPYLTCWAVKDNRPFTPYPVTDGWTSSGAGTAMLSRDSGTYRITEYGQKGWSFALVVDEDTRKNGGMHCGTNGNAYNKIYFDMTGDWQAAAGDTLRAAVHWEIEKTRTQK